MYQVAVLPPSTALGEVESFRRLHDPAFHRLPPHVPLLPPFEPIRTDFLTRFDEVRGSGFNARLGEPRVEGGALYLTAVEGAKPLARLRDSLTTALLDPAAPLSDGPPMLRVGVLPTEGELELARRTLAALGELPRFRVTRVSLLLEDVRGIWHTIRERRLA